MHQHKSLWQFDSFANLNLPWQEAYPALAKWLNAQQEVDLEDADQVDEIINVQPSLAQFFHWPQTFLATIQARRDASQPPAYLAAGVKGRKWSQIEAFAARTPVVDRYLEWCAGKGHLGKYLAFQGNKQVASIEWQKSLCDAGQQKAQQLSLKQHFHCADVLTNPSIEPLETAECVVALHACGDLHRVLLEQVSRLNTPHICIAPCCYHLTRAEEYHPLSRLASQAKLSLRKADLKLAVKQIATANAREQRLQKQELTYRLGFDLWQRHVRQTDQYLAVPSIQKALLSQGFVGFCQWAAEQKQLTHLIVQQPFEAFQHLAEQRYHAMQKQQAISQWFRPALEYWLVLDRAIFLQEQGYQVDIGAFCDGSLTPRNWMIRATLATSFS
ncbi:methyltransferase [Marinomonas posidonica]|uniref:methyltransferase n=1 Tax=Marinomonas posidonica TaxID=936476 RepID=UPI001494FF87|nr:methyltransferase [Marinomonas posidonica]